MRRFSKNEKTVINKILDLASKNQTNCAYNLFFDIQGSLYGLTSGFDIRYDGISEVLYFDPNKYKTQSDFSKIHWGLISDFHEFVFLMDFLVENEYVAIDVNKPIASEPAEWFISTDFIKGDLQKKLTKYFECYIYPSNKLFELKKNKFRLADELKQDRQFWITTWVAIAAVVVAFLPFIFDRLDYAINGDVQKIQTVDGSGISTKQ